MIKLLAYAGLGSLLFCLLGLPLPAKAFSLSQNKISVDTLWTKSNSPYILVENLTIAQGATLTIEPGVIVKSIGMLPVDFIIEGNIIAKAETDDHIQFNNLNMIIDSPAQTLSTLEAIDFHGEMKIIKGVVKIFKSVFESNNIAIEINSPSWGNDSQFLGNIIKNSDIGLKISGATKMTLLDNTFTNNGVGIFIDANQKTTLRGNDIMENTRQRSSGDNFGIYLSPDINNTIDAKENWWGSATGPTHATNPTGNGEKISDGVIYNDWLQGLAAYSLKPGDIQLNEIFPHPTNEPGGEWVELFNKLGVPITLYQATIADKTSDDNFNLTLLPRSYGLIISDEVIFNQLWPNIQAPKVAVGKIGGGLNNSGDLITLTDNSLILDKIDYPSGEENFSYAKYDDGWHWTNSATPGATNAVIAQATSSSATIQDCPKTTIRTAKKLINQCVIITGKVTKNNGSTFYIKDKTGEIKIYLQAKWQIKKPKLHLGDLLQVRGAVNNYRGIIRILPTATNHLKIIKAAKGIATKTAKKALAARRKQSSLKTTKPAMAATVIKPSPTIVPIPSQLALSSDTQIKPLVKSAQVSNTSESFYWSIYIALGLALMMLMYLVGFNLGRKYAHHHS